MSLDHAILGFLSFKPMSGYDLKKTFDRSVQHFWPANQSQIYRTLARLEDKGFIMHDVIEREGPLDIKQYHITPSGEGELKHWLATPLPDNDFREPFLIQIYFGGKLTDQELLTIIADQESKLEEQQHLFQVMLANYQEQMQKSSLPRTYFMSVTTLEFGILTNETVLIWLKSVRERLQNQDFKLIQSIKELNNE